MVQNSTIQQAVVNELSNYASSKSEMAVKVERVKMNLPFLFRLEGVNIRDHHDQLMMQVPSLLLNVNNYSRKKKELTVNTISLNNPYFYITAYKDEKQLNLQKFLRSFSPAPEDKKDDSKMSVICRNLKVSNSILSYNQFNKAPKTHKGVDFNRLQLKDLDVHIKSLKSNAKGQWMLLKSFSGTEKSGLIIDDMESFIEVNKQNIYLHELAIVTPKSRVNTELRLNFDSFADFKQVVKKLRFDGEFTNTMLHSSDLGYFVSTFYKTNNMLEINGNLGGRVDSLVATDFSFNLGDFTAFKGNIEVKGLPDVKSMHSSLDIDYFFTHRDDVAGLQLRKKNGVPFSIPMPEIFNNLGSISIKGFFSGLYNDFISQATFSSPLGTLITDMKMQQVGEGIGYQGRLELKNFEAGSFADVEGLGEVNLKAKLNGNSDQQNHIANLDSSWANVNYQGYTYDNIKVNGQILNKSFDGNIKLDDELVGLNFDGSIDFNGKTPEYGFAAQIRDARIAEMKLLKDTANPVFSTNLNVNIHGNKMDNLIGSIIIDSTAYLSDNKDLKMDNLSLVAASDPNTHQNLIDVKSDYLNGRVSGKYVYKDIVPAFNFILHTYLPSLFKDTVVNFPENTISTKREMHYDITLKNGEDILDVLTNGRLIADKINAEGRLAIDDKKVEIQASSDKLLLAGKEIINWTMLAFNGGGFITSEMDCESLQLTDSITIYNTEITSKAGKNIIDNNIEWKLSPLHHFPDASINNRLVISNLPKLLFEFDDSFITLEDSIWTMEKGSSLTLEGNRITADNIKLANKDQEIVVHGISSPNIKDRLQVDMNGIDMSWLDIFTVPKKVDFDGEINGVVVLRNILQAPRIVVDAKIDDFYINGDLMGTASLKSLWDDKKKGMKIDAGIIYTGNSGSRQVMAADGYVYPRNKKRNFDIDFELDNFKLHTINNWLRSITSDLRGVAQGKLHLDGTFRKIDLSGDLKVIAKKLYIDYLNTTYSFAHNIKLTNNSIEFDNIEIDDNNRRTSKDEYQAFINGSVNHRHFKNFSLDLRIDARNFTMLNTNGKQDKYYYGKALATGTIDITGPVNDIDIKVKAKTEKNTSLAIPLDIIEEVKENSYITFTKPDSLIKINTAKKIVERTRKDLSGVRLDFDLEVTPDAEIQLIFDPLVGDMITGRGEGDMSLTIDTRGEFQMKGDYIITQGDYLFTLENVINKHFNVREGGVISWTGDPYDAEINMDAYTSRKPSLHVLQVDNDTTRRKERVDCVIHLSGKLFNPDIEFDIEFPEMRQFEAERYKAAIAPNLSYQFLALLAVNSFISPQESVLSANTIVNMAGITPADLFTSQVSVWLSNISDEFDIDFAYHPEGELTKQQLDIVFSTVLLNDRLVIKGDVGVGGQSTVSQAQEASDIVGEFEVEYKLTEEGKFKLKFFNHYNEEDLLYQGAPYTQGIGVFYRKEFDSIRELFRKKEENDTITQ